ncbi:MAG TPA: hypothetical protein EYP88_04715 [Anaerolineales bacterium]|nr:hypothetical protein [Anaerolineales bacterium]
MMDTDLLQLALFDPADTTTGAMELFPEVWAATQGLSSPDLMVRRESLDRLIALDAVNLSPLVAYVVATRIFEPNLELRRRVVEVLGKVFLPHETGKLPPPEVRIHLRGYCMLIERRGVLNLLEVADAFPDAESYIAAILNACSRSGAILAAVMSDRKMPLNLRQQAINFIGQVGFLDAIPALEKLEERLEARMNGQKTMPFAPLSVADERSLLPGVQAALILLREP